MIQGMVIYIDMASMFFIEIVCIFILKLVCMFVLSCLAGGGCDIIIVSVISFITDFIIIFIIDFVSNFILIYENVSLVLLDYILIVIN